MELQLPRHPQAQHQDDFPTSRQLVAIRAIANSLQLDFADAFFAVVGCPLNAASRRLPLCRRSRLWNTSAAAPSWTLPRASPA